MAVCYKMNRLKELRNRKVFFDTNILIYLFFDFDDNDWKNTYRKIFKQLLSLKIPICLDYLVISEFINKCMRIRYEIYCTKASEYKFKEFRNSNDGNILLEDIHTIVRDFITKFEVIGHVFDKKQITDLLANHNLDFNDKAILTLCKENNLILFTNDIDFKSSDIEILTANNKYFTNSYQKNQY